MRTVWTTVSYLTGLAIGLCLTRPTMGEDNTNLAAGRPCKVFSSNEADGRAATQLTDGLTDGPGWSSKAFPRNTDHRLYPEYVIVDLGRNCLIHEVVLYPCGSDSAPGKGFPADFSIQVCREGEHWRTITRQNNYAAPEDGRARHFNTDNSEGRFVKMEATTLTSTGDGIYQFQLAEIEVYGQEKRPEPLTAESPPQLSGQTMLIRPRCENWDDPIGMDVPKPRFSWCMSSPLRGQCQTAYRVLVASDRKTIDSDQGNLWDTGKIAGDASIAIRYQGQPLQAAEDYYWKVMAWDKDGAPTPWSPTAKFVTGKFQPDDWKGRWIGAKTDNGHAAVYLRKEIEIRKPVRRALAFFSGLGFSELFIEGRKVGEDVLVPGFTSYDKRVQYLAYDVTDRLAGPGRRGLGVILADGWYNLSADPWVHKFETNPYIDKPKLLLDLHIEYEDGASEIIASDSSWKYSDGPITRSWIAEEDVDLRKTREGWDRAGYDDSAWADAVEAKPPGGRLFRQKEPPSRITEHVKPIGLRHDPASDSWVFDLGREVNGRLRLRATGPAGTLITITTVPSIPRTRTSQFVLGGGSQAKCYEPRFSNSAARQVFVKGLTSPPALDDLTIGIVSSVTQPTRYFQCSDDMANWLNETVLRTVINYTTWLPNDPVREYKAWTQDEQSMFWSSAYLFDCQTMYQRWQYDFLDGQRPDGSLPNVTPGAFFDDYNSPWWGGCAVWLPWEWYQYYGDSSLLEESYPAMKRYVDYLGTQAKDGLQDWGLLDWFPVEETPRAIINTPAHYLFSRIVSRTAGLLGKQDDSRRYAEMAERIRADFNQRFLDAATGIYGEVGWKCRQGNSELPVNHEAWWPGDRPCTQAGQVLPLALDMTPQEAKPAVQKALLREIQAHRGLLSTGFVSTPYLLALLADLDPQAGWRMTSTQDYPSWYSMTAGSDHDLLKECWDGGLALMPSLGGNITAWYYQSLGGIRPDSTGPGFKKIIIKPNMIGDLHWVDCRYDSVHGPIVSNWRRRGAQIAMSVSIPANSTATVHIPASNMHDVFERGTPAAQAQGVRFLRQDEHAAVFEVQSGDYAFTSTQPSAQ